MGSVNDPGRIPRLGPTSTPRLAAKRGTGSEICTTDVCNSYDEYEHPRTLRLSRRHGAACAARGERGEEGSRLRTRRGWWPGGSRGFSLPAAGPPGPPRPWMPPSTRRLPRTPLSEPVDAGPEAVTPRRLVKAFGLLRPGAPSIAGGRSRERPRPTGRLCRLPRASDNLSESGMTAILRLNNDGTASEPNAAQSVIARQPLQPINVHERARERPNLTPEGRPVNAGTP